MIRFAAVLLLLAGACQAQESPLTVLATERVQLGEWVQIRVQTAEAKSSVVRIWRIAPGPDVLVDAGLLELKNGDYAFVGPSATYRIEALAVIGDAIVTADATSIIGSDPKPQPPPKPDDPVVPVVPGKRWVILVRETADSSPEMANLVASIRKTVDPYAVQKGHRVLILDDDSVDALGAASPTLKPWFSKATSHGLPAILIGDPKTPEAAYVGPVPKTADEVLALIKQQGG